MNGYDNWLIYQEEAAEGWRDDVPTEEELIKSGVIADEEEDEND
ncbi:prophage P2a protein 15 [Lactiplantibacillus plantarum]|nr:prophage P2a protein 15 [Lactiplantibacillus plantarum]MCG0767670.1 prophage P2a protein 15 [Lactiplantibacillus plantarum]